MRRPRPQRGARSQYLAILVAQAWFPPGLALLNRLHRSSLRSLGFARHAGRSRPPHTSSASSTIMPKLRPLLVFRQDIAFLGRSKTLSLRVTPVHSISFDCFPKKAITPALAPLP